MFRCASKKQNVKLFPSKKVLLFITELWLDKKYDDAYISRAFAENYLTLQSMIKILPKYLIKEHVGPFIFALLVINSLFIITLSIIMLFEKILIIKARKSPIVAPNTNIV